MKTFKEYLDESTEFDRPKFKKYLLSNGYTEAKKNTHFIKNKGNKVCLVSTPNSYVAGFMVLDTSKLEHDIEFEKKQWVDAIVKSPSLPSPSDGFAIAKGLEYLKTELDKIENFKI